MEITIEQVRADANKYIAKNLELFNQEPTYDQVVGFVVKPILHELQSLQSSVDLLVEALRKCSDFAENNCDGHEKCRMNELHEITNAALSKFQNPSSNSENK